MHPAPTPSRAGSLLVDAELEALSGSALRVRPGAAPITRAQVSPASLDLRLGARAWRMRSGFLPGAGSVEARIDELALSELDLSRGAVLERGIPYLAEIEEELALDPDLRARFNPRSSTGRCDVFTRVLCAGHPRFDEAPAGYRGRLWIEISPLSFPVRVARGDRLAQLRLARGNAALDAGELQALHARTPLVYDERGPAEALVDDEGALALRVGLASRDPAGWRSAAHTDVVEFAVEGAHDPADFWEPVHARGGRCILEPGSFYIFASHERLVIPPDHAAEMLPIDVGVGELRNNYAGFFDNGFGWSADGATRGTPAVLEVRAHDVPFLVEDGQPFCRLRFFRTSRRPDRLYGEGRAASYRNQDLTLARCFRARGAT
ncbi:MAG: 2'-deoxycytidine 5'-triphosphate deaminase [Planctomycetota bacterium]|nr:2'-deoxycytidine 5'-triphosphate deaminase [Planctomycetota bacterium]